MIITSVGLHIIFYSARSFNITRALRLAELRYFSYSEEVSLGKMFPELNIFVILDDRMSTKLLDMMRFAQKYALPNEHPRNDVEDDKMECRLCYCAYYLYAEVIVIFQRTQVGKGKTTTGYPCRRRSHRQILACCWLPRCLMQLPQ